MGLQAFHTLTVGVAVWPEKGDGLPSFASHFLRLIFPGPPVKGRLLTRGVCVGFQCCPLVYIGALFLDESLVTAPGVTLFQQHSGKASEIDKACV